MLAMGLEHRTSVIDKLEGQCVDQHIYHFGTIIHTSMQSPWKTWNLLTGLKKNEGIAVDRVHLPNKQLKGIEISRSWWFPRSKQVICVCTGSRFRIFPLRRTCVCKVYQSHSNARGCKGTDLRIEVQYHSFQLLASTGFFKSEYMKQIIHFHPSGCHYVLHIFGRRTRTINVSQISRVCCYFVLSYYGCWQGCGVIVQLQADPGRAGVAYDKEFIVCSLDLLSGLAEGLGSSIEGLVRCECFDSVFRLGFPSVWWNLLLDTHSPCTRKGGCLSENVLVGVCLT